MNDGGPAFPEITSEYSSDEHAYTGNVYSEGGMSLRDYFAAKAIQGLLASWSVEPGAYMARYSYEIADLMLDARSKTLANEEKSD